VEALSVGINWVLAPVADLDVEPDNPIVQTRAFGDDPEAVAAAVTAWIVGCEAAGAMACAKHFPGHGRTRTDSHLGLPAVDAPAEVLEADLLPFQAAIGAGVSSVMTAHVAFPALDPSGAPATFSKPILDILRHRFGFDGLIVSDALMMEGARGGRSQGEIGREALRAGVDLLLYPDQPAVVADGLAAGAARDGGLARRIEESLARYQAALEAVALEPRPDRVPPSGGAMATSDWLLSGPLLRDTQPPLRAPIELVIVDDDLGTPWPVSPTTWVAEALAARGIALGSGGSRVVLAFAEPRASKGRSGFGPASLARLSEAVPGAALTVLFTHPRLLAELPGEGPVLHAWHRQRLMQEAVARWLAARVA
jgi:beta-glucosidase-like glycosyl hydrolase